MLVTERKTISRQMREGMIDGYLQCLQLTGDITKQGAALPFCIDDRTDALYPPAYLTYRDSWLELGAAAVRNNDMEPAYPALNYRKWRELAAELQEDAALHAMFGYPASAREVGLRAMLLLPADTSLADSLPDLALESEEQRGLIAAYETCRNLTDHFPYDNAGLGTAIMQRLYALLPRDYLEYCRRFNVAAAWYGNSTEADKPFEYPAWRQAVAQLHEEARRCAEQQRPAGRRYRSLRRQLLLVEGEPDPTPFDQNDDPDVQ